VVLRWDKKDCRTILEAVQTHTGESVEMLGQTTKSKQKKTGSQTHASNVLP